MQEETGVDRLVQERLRIIVDAGAALLQDHLALRQHDLVIKNESGHAIGLELHHELEPVGGDILIEGGVIMGGEGIIAPAILGDDPGKGAGRHGFGPLEHQMLEEMGDA